MYVQCRGNDLTGAAPRQIVSRHEDKGIADGRMDPRGAARFSYESLVFHLSGRTCWVMRRRREHLQSVKKLQRR